jgi:very-short-patch-repair endonuclease
LRHKQLGHVQFYRQKPIGGHVVDFFAPRAGLVIEVDGSQHMLREHLQRDQKRDAYLTGLGLKVLRFSSRQVLTETEAVLEAISRTLKEQLKSEIPPFPPFSKGGKEYRH